MSRIQFSDLIAKATEAVLTSSSFRKQRKCTTLHDVQQWTPVIAGLTPREAYTQRCARIRGLEHSQLQHSLMIKAWHESKQPTDRLVGR